MHALSSNTTTALEAPFLFSDAPAPEDPYGVSKWEAEQALWAVAAVRALAPGFQVWNLGTGQGVSVFEMIRAFEAASGRSVPFDVVARRPGDIAVCYADATQAEQDLGWRALRGLPEMMADAWRWQHQNPNGYQTPP